MRSVDHCNRALQPLGTDPNKQDTGARNQHNKIARPEEELPTTDRGIGDLKVGPKLATKGTTNCP